MDYNILNTLVTQGNSTRDISKTLNTSNTNVRYWLKKYKLKTRYSNSSELINSTNECSRCKLLKPISEFHNRPDRKGKQQSYCKSCFNNYCDARWINAKKKAIEYKGSKCVDCNKSFDYYLYDFHHLIPSEKECSWTKLRLRSWENIKKELDKCVLLCCMCHRIREYSGTLGGT